MATASQTTSIWQQKLIEPLRKSPQKAGALGVLTAVMLLLWIHAIGKGPRAARGQSSILPSLSSQTATPATASPTRFALGGTTDPFLKWARQPIKPIGRDLFSIPLDFYPRDFSRASAALSNQDSFWTQLGKSMTSQADQQEQRQNLIENLRVQAASLKLQSIVMGQEPTAMINGEMFRQGSIVSGFRIQRIEPRRIVVENQGIRLAIIMN